MRVELGLKPMNNTRSSTLPANPEVSEAKVGNIKIGQHILGTISTSRSGHALSEPKTGGR